MIETSLIVKDTRKIRCAISDRFDNDVDSYIDYLLSLKKRADISKPQRTKGNRAIKNKQAQLESYAR